MGYAFARYSFLRRLPALLRHYPYWGKLWVWYRSTICRSPLQLRSRHGLMFEFSPSDWLAHQFCIPQTLRVFNDDPSLIAYLEKTLKAGDIVVDVGALIGAISLVSAKIVSSSGCVFAFEPEARNFRRLCKHIEINRLSNLVPLQQIVYSENGTKTLNVFPVERPGWHTLGDYEVDGFKPIERQQISAITLDTFCLTKGIRRIDLLKLDVEGAEADVFAGARQLLQEHTARKIVFEISLVPLGGMRHTVDDVVMPLLKNGYRIHCLRPDGSLGSQVTSFEGVSFANLVAIAPNEEFA